MAFRQELCEKNHTVFMDRLAPVHIVYFWVETFHSLALY
jgi:hypothetical protein